MTDEQEKRLREASHAEQRAFAKAQATHQARIAMLVDFGSLAWQNAVSDDDDAERALVTARSKACAELSAIFGRPDVEAAS